MTLYAVHRRGGDLGDRGHLPRRAGDLGPGRSCWPGSAGRWPCCCRWSRSASRPSPPTWPPTWSRRPTTSRTWRRAASRSAPAALITAVIGILIMPVEAASAVAGLHLHLARRLLGAGSSSRRWRGRWAPAGPARSVATASARWGPPRASGAPRGRRAGLVLAQLARQQQRGEEPRHRVVLGVLRADRVLHQHLPHHLHLLGRADDDEHIACAQPLRGLGRGDHHPVRPADRHHQHPEALSEVQAPERQPGYKSGNCCRPGGGRGRPPGVRWLRFYAPGSRRNDAAPPGPPSGP